MGDRASEEGVCVYKFINNKSPSIIRLSFDLQDFTFATIKCKNWLPISPGPPHKASAPPWPALCAYP